MDGTGLAVPPKSHKEQSIQNEKKKETKSDDTHDDLRVW